MNKYTLHYTVPTSSNPDRIHTLYTNSLESAKTTSRALITSGCKVIKVLATEFREYTSLFQTGFNGERTEQNNKEN